MKSLTMTNCKDSQRKKHMKSLLSTILAEEHEKLQQKLEISRFCTAFTYRADTDWTFIYKVFHKQAKFKDGFDT